MRLHLNAIANNLAPALNLPCSLTLLQSHVEFEKTAKLVTSYQVASLLSLEVEDGLQGRASLPLLVVAEQGQRDELALEKAMADVYDCFELRDMVLWAFYGVGLGYLAGLLFLACRLRPSKAELDY
jgi:hypothetical protein